MRSRWGWVGLTAVAALLALVFWRFVAAAWWAPLETGSKADWVSSVSSVLGTVLTGLAGFIAWRVLLVERRRDDAATRAAEAAQASAVGVWARYEPAENMTAEEKRQVMVEGPTGGVSVQGFRLEVTFQNDSRLPVFIVRTRVHGGRGGNSEEIKIDILPPGTTKIRPSGYLSRVPGDLPLFSVIFRDSKNRWWGRTISGRLVGPFTDVRQAKAASLDGS